MKKEILVSLVLVLLVFSGCKKEEPTTVYVEPEPIVQDNKTTQVVVNESQTTTDERKSNGVDVGEGGSVDVDLSDYPSPFIKDGKLNTYVIVGARATSLEVVAATELLEGIPFVERIGDYYPDALDTDFNSISDKNAILIGNPCNNRFIEALMPYTSDCLEDFNSGEAIIKLFKTGANSYALVVGGYSGADTRRAAQYLGDYKSKSLGGISMTV